MASGWESDLRPPGCKATVLIARSDDKMWKQKLLKQNNCVTPYQNVTFPNAKQLKPAGVIFSLYSRPVRRPRTSCGRAAAPDVLQCSWSRAAARSSGPAAVSDSVAGSELPSCARWAGLTGLITGSALWTAAAAVQHLTYIPLHVAAEASADQQLHNRQNER